MLIEGFNQNQALPHLAPARRKGPPALTQPNLGRNKDARTRAGLVIAPHPHQGKGKRRAKVLRLAGRHLLQDRFRGGQGALKDRQGVCFGHGQEPLCSYFVPELA